ncbi:MAG: leucyl aminopeptidase [Actinomycetia bacterium]|nr:leucyl aminopeptidase [Actinomycetes bacterium]
MPVTVTAVPTLPTDVDVVGVPAATGPVVLGAGNGITDAQLVEAGFEGKAGETTTIGGTIVVGVGPAADVTPEVVRRASAALVKATWKRGSIASLLLDAVPADGDRAAAGQAAAEGTVLSTYRFGRYKKDAGETKLESVAIVATGGKKVRDAVERGVAVAGAVAMARDLVNTPAGDLTPPMFADAAVKVGEAAGLTVEVIDDKQAKKLGLGGLLGVGGASDNPPRMVKLTYTPAGRSRGHLALVGKGITFDSGGLSIKPADGMIGMKGDMAGAAAVLAAMSVLPVVNAPVQVTGYLCIAENMINGHAIRPGDVLTIKNGTTVEVLNTDAEGRLVLADGLSLAAAEAPDAIIDLATLTGACMVALGPTIAGLMGNNDALVEQVQAAADRTAESVWHLPLPKAYRKDLDSDIADLKNIAGGRYGGALHAGLFLQEFVDGTPWVHLDIAGPADAKGDDGYTPKGASGFGVRTIVETALSFKKPGRAK